MSELEEWSKKLPLNNTLSYAVASIKSDKYKKCNVYIIGNTTEDALNNRNKLYKILAEDKENETP